MLKSQIDLWLKEDVGFGDYSSLATIAPDQLGEARLLVKEQGVLAGVEVAREIIRITDPEATFERYKQDGDWVEPGDIAFKIVGRVINLLSTERLILNCMQRMSGIATKTRFLQQKIAHTSARLLDTRKTTPGFRMLEKQAVLIGGGLNHRHGLYDMIMLKDNHLDFCGGIANAVTKTLNYIEAQNLDIKIEVEVRNLKELNEVILFDQVDRIMLDNFTPEEISSCIKLIPGHFETEASGGINEDNIVAYAETGIQFISVGALTHNVKSLDLSLKANLGQ
jgi:nicotinate-nucleotide pyrophosphorylase (carboxylating)